MSGNEVFSGVRDYLRMGIFYFCSFLKHPLFLAAIKARRRENSHDKLTDLVR